MMLKKIIVFITAILLNGSAFAGSSTIGVTPGTGNTYDVITDGSGNFVGMFGLCDGTAAASCAAVTSGAVKIAGAGVAGTPSGGVISVQGVASGTNLPVSQATASNLNATVVGTGTFAVQATLQASSATAIGTVNPTTAANWGIGATGSSVPANAIYLGIISGGNLTGWTGAVTNAGTFAVQAAQSGTWNITNISGTVSLPTGAATSANQTNASQKTQIVDGSGNVIASTSNNLNVQCANCSGSGASATDAATFTAGASTFAPSGGQFTSGGATACVTGHQCFVGMTAARAFLMDVSSVNGTTTLTGTGAVGTGAQRVAIGTDTATIAGSSPGTAGSASSNVVTVQGIASGTNLSVSQATAANLNATIIGTGTFAVQATLQASATTAIGKVDPNTIATWGLSVGTTPATAPTNTLIVGAIYNSSAPSPTTGQTLPLQLDSAGNLNVNIKAGAGSGGTAIADGATFTEASTSFTPVGGEYVSGGGANCTTGKGCTVQTTIDRMLYVNVGKINAVVPLMGNGTTGTGSQRVTIASDNTAFSVNSNTAQVNGVTTLTGTGAVGTGAQRIAVGTDTATIAGSSPGTAGTASSNVITVQGIASMTKLLVTPDSVALPANQSVNVSQINGVTPLMGNGVTGTGSQRVTIASDNTAFSVNATLQASATTAIGKVDPNTAANWGIGATGSAVVANAIYQGINVSGNTRGLTGVNPSGSVYAAQIDLASVNGVTTLTGTGATGTGAQRVTVSTDQATNAGAALVKGGVGVVNGGSFYQAVAASQTATVLQSSTGATGDYLSHCVIYPTSTSPGVVTVFDNTNTAANSAILFPGGASSTSNLVPFAVPVGAVSVNGAWKVTTGANVSATCFGKFS